MEYIEIADRTEDGAGVTHIAVDGTDVKYIVSRYENLSITFGDTTLMIPYDREYDLTEYALQYDGELPFTITLTN